MEDTSDSIKTMVLKQLKPSIITLGDEINLSVILGENWFEDSPGDNSAGTVDNAPEKTKTSKEEATCTFCSKTFPSRRYLNRHISKHTNQYSCSHCKKSFSRKETLIKHMSRCKVINPQTYPTKRKRNANNETSKYYCEKCNKNFTRRENYEQHIMIHRNMQVICNICQKILHSLKSYRRHQRIHEENKVTFFCEHCPATFSLKSNLKRHIKSIQHQKDTIICKKCNRCIKSDKLLLKHQNNETTRCIACSEIFCLDKDFKNHIKETHILWFRCKQCSTSTPFMTRRDCNLRDHARKIHNLTLEKSDCYKDGWYMLLKNY